MQKGRNSSALTMELHLFCIMLSIQWYLELAEVLTQLPRLKICFVLVSEAILLECFNFYSCMDK